MQFRTFFLLTLLAPLTLQAESSLPAHPSPNQTDTPPATSATESPGQLSSTQPGASSAESVVQLNTLVVNGYRFLDEDTSGITNLPLPIEKVPQSISLVNNAFIKAADLKNMGEVAQYTTGAMWASFSPSYGNQFWLRGFSAGYAIDGLTVGDQMTEPDPSTLERYEVVKGPASVVYGAQSPGGIVNLVSKAATANTPNYLQVIGGSWGRWRVEAQATGALTSSGSIRAIAVVAHEQGDSFVDFVHTTKTVLYGGLDFKVMDDLTGYVRGNYQRTADTPFNGLPTYPDGSLVPLPRSFYLGAMDFQAIARAMRLETGWTWKPADLWTFDLKSIYQHTRHGGDNVYNYDYIGFDGTFPIGGEHFTNWHVEDFTIGASSTRKLDDLGLSDSSISANVRYQHYRYNDNEGFWSGGPATINGGDAALSDIFESMVIGPNTYAQDQRMNYLTASSQAIVKVASPLTFIGGVAYSNPSINLQVNHGDSQNFDPGHQLSYRGAAVFELSKNLNLYASYSESFQPNLRLNVDLGPLAPITGKQYEAGVKFISSNRLLLTGAVFDIKESNVAIYDSMVNGEALYRSSDVRHRGVELEATGRLADHWEVKGGLALLDSVITHDPAHPINNGERQPWLPRTTANLYTSYTFKNGITVSGGVRYIGAVKTYNTSSALATPAIASYIIADAGVSYGFDRWLVQLNLKNAFDRRYSVSTPLFQSLSAGLYPGEPTSISVSVQRNF